MHGSNNIYPRITLPELSQNSACGSIKKANNTNNTNPPNSAVNHTQFPILFFCSTINAIIFEAASYGKYPKYNTCLPLVSFSTVYLVWHPSMPNNPEAWVNPRWLGWLVSPTDCLQMSLRNWRHPEPAVGPKIRTRWNSKGLQAIHAVMRHDGSNPGPGPGPGEL